MEEGTKTIVIAIEVQVPDSWDDTDAFWRVFNELDFLTEDSSDTDTPIRVLSGYEVKD